MNIFFVFNDGSMQTPPLDGTILPGITRASILAFSKDRSITVREESYAFSQWRADAASGRLTESFACGTAAVLAPIGRVKFPGGEFTIGNGESGHRTEALRADLIDIQRCRAPDTHRWVHRVF